MYPSDIFHTPYSLYPSLEPSLAHSVATLGLTPYLHWRRAAMTQHPEMFCPEEDFVEHAISVCSKTNVYSNESESTELDMVTTILQSKWDAFHLVDSDHSDTQEERETAEATNYESDYPLLSPLDFPSLVFCSPHIPTKTPEYFIDMLEDSPEPIRRSLVRSPKKGADRLRPLAPAPLDMSAICRYTPESQICLTSGPSPSSMECTASSTPEAPGMELIIDLGDLVEGAEESDISTSSDSSGDAAPTVELPVSAFGNTKMDAGVPMTPEDNGAMCSVIDACIVRW